MGLNRRIESTVQHLLCPETGNRLDSICTLKLYYFDGIAVLMHQVGPLANCRNRLAASWECVLPFTTCQTLIRTSQWNSACPPTFSSLAIAAYGASGCWLLLPTQSRTSWVIGDERVRSFVLPYTRRNWCGHSYTLRRLAPLVSG